MDEETVESNVAKRPFLSQLKVFIALILFFGTGFVVTVNMSVYVPGLCFQPANSFIGMECFLFSRQFLEFLRSYPLLFGLALADTIYTANGVSYVYRFIFRPRAASVAQ